MLYGLLSVLVLFLIHPVHFVLVRLYAKDISRLRHEGDKPDPVACAKANSTDRNVRHLGNDRSAPDQPFAVDGIKDLCSPVTPPMNIVRKHGSISFTVRVVPRASKSRIVGEHDGALKIQLVSPPVDGAANAELVKLLAKQFSIPKSDIEIISGQTSKTKGTHCRDHDSRPQRSFESQNLAWYID